MACQSLKTNGKDKLMHWRRKWNFVESLHLLILILGEVTSLVSPMAIGEVPAGEGLAGGVGYAKQGFNLRSPSTSLPYRFPPPSYKSMALMSKQAGKGKPSKAAQRRLKPLGNEILPAVGAGSNDISDEPTCDELRAMWRYYKRQSRAETNEISQFGKNPFFGMLPSVGHTPVISSFGLNGRGRTRNRLRPSNPLYGRPMYKPNRGKERGGGRNQKPFETVREMLGKQRPSSPPITNSDNNNEGDGRGRERGSSSGPDAIILLSPPSQPAKESSFQKLKDIYRKERMREREASSTSPSSAAAAAAAAAPHSSTVTVDNRDFGKIVLSPPRGQDGRRMNKPLELMTAFEKIRFGHADDLLDEGIKPNLDHVGMLKKKRPAIPPRTSGLFNSQFPRWGPLLVEKDFITQPILRFNNLQTISSPSSATRSKLFETGDDNVYNTALDETSDKEQRLESPTSFYDFPSLARTADIPGRVAPNDIRDFNDASTLSAFNSPLGQIMESTTCAEMEFNPCNQTSDCSCIGMAMYRCYLNQCQILPLAYSAVEEAVSAAASTQGGVSPGTSSEEEVTEDRRRGSEVWHSEPIPSEKLGLWEEPVVDAERLSSFRTSKNEGKSNRLSEATYLVLQGEQ